MLSRSTDDSILYTLIVDYLEWLQRHNYSNRTINDRVIEFLRFYDWCVSKKISDPNEVTRKTLEGFQGYLFQHKTKRGKQLEFSTLRMRFVPIKSLFKWLAEQEHIKFDPSSTLRMPKVERKLPSDILSADEVETVLSSISTIKKYGFRNRVIMEVLYATGIRRFELANLEINDVHYGRRLLFVRNGKGKKDRYVAISDRALNWIKRYINENRGRFLDGGHSNLLFIKDGAEGLSCSGSESWTVIGKD